LSKFFAKNQINVYTWIIVPTTLCILYNKQLLELLTDPPKYIFFAGFIIYFLQNNFNTNKEQREIMYKELKLEITDVRNEITDVRDEIQEVKKENMRQNASTRKILGKQIAEVQKSINLVLEALGNYRRPQP
jgi:peptidoglycan hydrolase CwlO-like protein